MEIVNFIISMKYERYSDIHIRENENIYYRRDGYIIRGDKKIVRNDFEFFLMKIHMDNLLNEVITRGEIDFGFEFEGVRFRGNIFLEKGKIGMVFRKINESITSIEDLGMPKLVGDFSKIGSGIVIITGPTGSGKSSTLAAIVEEINANLSKHIITIEDPIEYYFVSKKSVITQREIGIDSKSFSNALKFSLRQDPDVIVIGEIRDKETLDIAMRAAETGHLCLCTLHTLGAGATINRITDMFDSQDRDRVRMQLSMVLKGIISQQLIHTKSGLVPVIELLISDSSSNNLIREGKISQLANYILTGKKKGLISMDDELIRLFKKDLISFSDLISHCLDMEYIKIKIGKSGNELRPWNTL